MESDKIEFSFDVGAVTGSARVSLAAPEP